MVESGSSVSSFSKGRGASSKLESPAKMNAEDEDIVNAERDADQQRFHDYDPNSQFEKDYGSLEASRKSRAEAFRKTTEEREAAEQPERAESVSSSSSSSIRAAGMNTSHRPSVATRASTRFEAEFMHYLDRHPTAVKRMQDRE